MFVIFFLFSFTPALVSALPADAPAGGTAEQRLSLRKKEQNIKLDSKELLRVTSKCTNVQSSVRELQTKLAPVVEKRSNIYKKIDAKLWIIIGQLKLADKDTFKLEQQRSEFAKQVTAYDNSMTQYKQTLDDIVVINCKADPAGFMALVKTAREYHTLIRKQSQDLNTYIVDTVKATLNAFTDELKPKPSTEGSN